MRDLSRSRRRRVQSVGKVFALLSGVIGVPANLHADGQPAANQGGELTVEVTGVGLPTGSVMIALFSREAGFPREMHRADFTKSVFVAKPKFRFSNLPAETYAVIVYHDLNDNRRLDKTRAGIPTEPFGMSHYESISKSNKPSFEKAIVDVSSTKQVSIPLLYPGQDQESWTSKPGPSF